MMTNQCLFSFSLALLVLFFYSTITTTVAQSPAVAPVKAAPVPAAATPAALVPTLPQSPSDNTPDTAATDIIGILRKAKSYSVFIRLLKITQLINQINSQLITTKSGGLTILAPDDSAFSELKAGFLNSLTDAQKLELLQFHILPNYVSSNNFDTLTNPVRTLAGDKPGRVDLNVTSYGGSVNISTGVVNTTVNGIVYTDKRLAIYKLDKVLLPLDFYATNTPAAAPALAPATAVAKAPKADKDDSSSSDDSSDSSQGVGTKEESGDVRMKGCGMWVSLGVALVATMTGNSSRAACGGVVRDGVGNAIFSFSRNLGCCTITWAELHGIMDGLELLWSRGVRTVEIETDSATATTLIYDNSNGSHPCTQLINRIKLLLSRPWNVSIKHVYRECNKVANFMAKFGQELSHGLHVFEHVPEGCLDLLEQDGIKVVAWGCDSSSMHGIAAPAPGFSTVPLVPVTPSGAPTPTAAAIVPKGPIIDIIQILRKAKKFSVLIRLLKTTQLINQLNSQLATSGSGGLTIFAPDDAGFSKLKAGFLNSLSDRQKVELLQFHTISTYISISNFDTLTNPVQTQAGDDPKRLQLNVTTYGGSQVSMTTGAVNASVTGTVYTDNKLAIYQVDKVLLPLDFVLPKASAPAPALAAAKGDSAKGDKSKSGAGGNGSGSGDDSNSSGSADDSALPVDTSMSIKVEPITWMPLLLLGFAYVAGHLI
ncbi:fasciclin-like arabinogalactan protein 12 [Senna tora]|uniref:Fasciclin-like arabinogalactan protein 12 n=1 Tax=Senna tora TaxID=362788 RepID=A0A834W656_9FABA|nr:fasciclin-like arabinogalactan protein 12 [Senna tora]